MAITLLISCTTVIGHCLRSAARTHARHRLDTAGIRYTNVVFGALLLFGLAGWAGLKTYASSFPTDDVIGYTILLLLAIGLLVDMKDYINKKLKRV